MQGVPIAAADNDRLIGLDALRAIASLAILIYHFPVFAFVDGRITGTDDLSMFPLHTMLTPAYRFGWLAVDCFFCLSGFIFAALYSRRIAARTVSLRTFLVARFSRLYPMHFLALIVTAPLLAAFSDVRGYGFMNTRYDTIASFFTEVVLITQWIGPNFVFNRPSWSISVEFLMYLIFFSTVYVCRRRYAWIALGIVAAAILLRGKLFQPVDRGLIGFFLGALAFEARNFLSNHRIAGMNMAPVFCAVALCVSAVGLYLMVDWAHELWAFRTILIADLGFAALVAACSGIRIGNPLASSAIALCGDLSYPAYMLHYPVQIATCLVCGLLNVATPVFSLWFLTLYLIGVVGAAWLIHRVFELRCRRWLRQRFMPQSSSDITAIAAPAARLTGLPPIAHR